MKYYGPFYKGVNIGTDGGEIWHWHKDCPDFPNVKNPETMISSSIPNKETLCKKCLQLDVNNSSPFSYRDSSKDNSTPA
ncbi:MAG TPA: hypothetical protein VHP32_09560 [Ignavibacteria bacterium]|nr:hypothetical protein [Ignavibacteria bacterium]